MPASFVSFASGTVSSIRSFGIPSVINIATFVTPLRSPLCEGSRWGHGEVTTARWRGREVSDVNDLFGIAPIIGIDVSLRESCVRVCHVSGFVMCHVFVMCQGLSCVRGCHVSGFVMCQGLSCVRGCHVSGFVMCHGLSCVRVCHVSGFVMCQGLSCVRVCHVSGFVMCLSCVRV